ncbi:hypothetical protein [Parerythrobacter aestuarii]|uniref:hypothetical protein n=1 Tax=Parerythrobacter aestuarii TaxID=3020909 RepID=UPI0024DE821B|nr:hypothetical protein [Parerythrobacter aestuarii]
MYRYDQAAWHGTDAVAAQVNLRDYPELRGYLVEPLDNGNLSFVFFAEDDAGRYEFARLEMDGSKVLSGGILESEERTRLSPRLEAMADARASAIDELKRQEWRFCSNSPANTLIFPPDDEGTVPVYFLTSTTEANLFPFGGHYRIDVKADGSVAASRKFTNSCLNLGLRKGPNGEKPVGIGVSHLLDEEPTEIHYFQSYYVPAKVFVMIDGAAWVIEKGKLDEKIEDFGQ